MSASQWVVSPFIDYGFMRRALAGACSLSLGAAPLGVFLVLRRMSLMGDAMSHAILPGVAAGFLLSGLSLWAMMLGGIATGLVVALLAGLVARLTPLREDASFAAFYLISLGLGVLLVSLRGSNMDLLHVLFGTVLGLDDASLLLVSITASVSL
ncbi:metal ABC transporter permease, partial [Achromobacter dolens]